MKSRGNMNCIKDQLGFILKSFLIEDWKRAAIITIIYYLDNHIRLIIICLEVESYLSFGESSSNPGCFHPG